VCQIISKTTDWGYLNDVLAHAFSIATAPSVTVVSPGDSASLETKAPLLWGKLHAMSHSLYAQSGMLGQGTDHSFS
jgi:hypothetical protein